MSEPNAIAFAAAGKFLAESYGVWSDWFALDGGRRFRVKRADDDGSGGIEEDTDTYGTFYDTRDDKRPRECNGASRKILFRSGYMWWQPPADIVNDPAILANVAARVKAYGLEEWGFTGIVVEIESAPCACCKERKRATESLTHIESDSGADYFAETVGDLIPEA